MDDQVHILKEKSFKIFWGQNFPFYTLNAQSINSTIKQTLTHTSSSIQYIVTYPKQPSKRIVKIVKVTTATTSSFMAQFLTELKSRNQFSTLCCDGIRHKAQRFILSRSGPVKITKTFVTNKMKLLRMNLDKGKLNSKKTQQIHYLKLF